MATLQGDPSREDSWTSRVPDLPGRNLNAAQGEFGDEE